MAPAEPVQDNWIELLEADVAVKLVGAPGAAIAVVTAACPSWRRHEPGRWRSRCRRPGPCKARCR